MATSSPAPERSRKRSRKKSRPADLYEAYLASRPEADPRRLLPRSALPLARGAFLLHGVVVEQWSAGWLAGFLLAEFFLIVRLAVLGDRWSGGPKLDPALHRRTSMPAQLAWLILSMAAIAFTGQGLDRSTRGAWFGFGGSEALWVWPGWGIVAYLVLLLGEFLLDLLAARREHRAFASASVLQATFFLVAVLLLAFAGVFVIAFASEWFGDGGARAVAALLLVLARTGSDLAVLWFPVWGPGRLASRQKPAR